MKKTRNLRMLNGYAKNARDLLELHGYKHFEKDDVVWYEKQERLAWPSAWIIVVNRKHIDGQLDVGIKQVQLFKHTLTVQVQEMEATAIFCLKNDTYNTYTLKAPKGKRAVNVTGKISQAAHTWILDKLQRYAAIELRVPNRKDAKHEVAVLKLQKGEATFSKPDYLDEFLQS